MTGLSWEQVEDMRLPNLMALVKWWGKHPPMAYAGGQADTKASDKEELLDDDGLVALLGGGA